MRTLVVFYSRTGTTEKIAEWFRGKDKVTVEEIVDKKKRKGIFRFILSGRDAIVGARTEIVPPEQDPSGFDQIVIVSPTWAGNMPPAIRTWLDLARVEEKRVGIIGIAGGQPPQKLFDDIEEMTQVRTQQQLAMKEDLVLNGEYKGKLKHFWKGFNLQ